MPPALAAAYNWQKATFAACGCCQDRPVAVCSAGASPVLTAVGAVGQQRPVHVAWADGHQAPAVLLGGQGPGLPLRRHLGTARWTNSGSVRGRRVEGGMPGMARSMLRPWVGFAGAATHRREFNTDWNCTRQLRPSREVRLPGAQCINIPVGLPVHVALPTVAKVAGDSGQGGSQDHCRGQEVRASMIHLKDY